MSNTLPTPGPDAAAPTEPRGVIVRQARDSDAPGVRAIYAPIVETTTISFETVAPTEQEIRTRIAAALRTHDWLVAERGGSFAGYAYGSAHRARDAYRRSVEVSAYVHEDHRGRGVAGALYAALLARLAALGFHAAFAGIAQPNAPSAALHRAAGFTPIGTFEQVGFKFGAWHDVSWWQRRLDGASDQSASSSSPSAAWRSKRSPSST